MEYELYVDSLFLINFVMNLYLLILVDQSALRTATRRGLILGAVVGAAAYLLPFCWDTYVWIKFPLCVVAGTGGMIGIAFRPKSFRGVCRILEKLLTYAFLLGGLLLFLNECLPFLQKKMLSVCGVLLFGAFGFLLITFVQEKRRTGRRDSTCRAVLIRGECRVSVTALIDSGNSLTEPISGKPVSVIDRELYRALWGKEEPPYRAVPYHSIGRPNGILKGFLLPELTLEADGVIKSLRDVYVAVSEDETGERRMILNPAVLYE